MHINGLDVFMLTMAILAFGVLLPDIIRALGSRDE